MSKAWKGRGNKKLWINRSKDSGQEWINWAVGENYQPKKREC